ncbi:MAG: GGDEF domain-containing protein [Spirochaetia bacterium]
MKLLKGFGRHPYRPIYEKFKSERQAQLYAVCPYVFYVHSLLLVLLVIMERVYLKTPILLWLELSVAAWQLIAILSKCKIGSISPRFVHLIYALEVFLFTVLFCAYSLTIIYYDFPLVWQAGAVLILTIVVSVEFLPAYALRSLMPLSVGVPLLCWYVLVYTLIDPEPLYIVLALFPLIAWIIGSLTVLVIERVYYREFRMRYLAEGRREKVKEELTNVESLNRKLEDTKQSLEKEIEERKSIEKKLEQVAAIDELTAVYNRRAGFELLKEAYHFAKRKQQPLTIAFVDVDKLKIVNDNFGHQAGDSFLKEVVELLRKHLRKSDSVSRFGGDEFLVILSECTQEEAHTIFKRIEEDMEQINRGERLFPFSFSYGIAEASSAYEESVHQLIAAADQRMYVNKQKKKWG